MNINGTEAAGAEERAKTAVSELRKRYSEKIREQYDLAAENLRRERDEALRENWVLRQKAEAALPEKLAAAGINGGASETVLAKLSSEYEGRRGDIVGDYMESLGELGAKSLEEKAETEKNFNEQWLEYLISLAKKEEEEKIENEYR